MPKIKIVWMQTFTDDYDSKQIMRCIDQDEFEEISQNDLDNLRKNLSILPRPSYEMHPHIIILDEEPLSAKLAFIQKQIEKHEAAVAEALKKRKEQADKKKAASVLKKKKLFESLKKEFEGAEK